VHPNVPRRYVVHIEESVRAGFRCTAREVLAWRVQEQSSPDVCITPFGRRSGCQARTHCNNFRDSFLPECIVSKLIEAETGLQFRASQLTVHRSEGIPNLL